MLSKLLLFLLVDAVESVDAFARVRITAAAAPPPATPNNNSTIAAIAIFFEVAIGTYLDGTLGSS